MATRSVSRASSSARSRHYRRKPALPDIHATLARFGRAQALITVALRSFEADDRMKSRPEALAFEVGLVALDVIYNELDAADRQLRSTARS